MRTVEAASIVVLGVLLANDMARAGSVPAACPGGRFVLAPDAAALVAGASGALVVDDAGNVAIGTVCPRIQAKRVRTTRTGTVVVASWPRCGTAKRVRLTVRLVDDGLALTGTRRARHTRPRRFTATCSTCGDGVVDDGNGEECDGAGCTAGSCLGCRCVPASTSSTTVTTTTSTSTSVPPGCPERCGDGVLDADCFEECDVADAVVALCPDGIAHAGCPRCTPGCKLDVACCPTTTTTSTTLPPRFSTDVLPILVARCNIAGCHGSPQFPGTPLLTPLAAYGQLVGVTATHSGCAGELRVAPGDPDASYLVEKLEGVGPCFANLRMPQGGPFLTAAQIGTIRNWIAAGASND